MHVNFLYMSSHTTLLNEYWQLFQHVLKIPCVVCVVQFSDLASLMLMSVDSVSYIHCPSKIAAINTLALKRWLTFIQGFVIQQLLQHSWLYLLVNISFLTGLVSSQRPNSPFLVLQTRETFSNWIYDPLNIMLYIWEPSDRFRKNLTIQHILELLGLIQTNKRLNIIYKWKKNTICDER